MTSRRLVRLLGGDVHTQMALTDLMRMANDDTDVRLLAEIIQEAGRVCREIGVDETDVHGEELYLALLAHASHIHDIAPRPWTLVEIDGYVISFHPEDVIENYHHQLPLGKHRVRAGRRGLGREITRRYKKHSCTHDASVEQAARHGKLID